MFRIMPRQKVYFDCFERCAKAGTEAAGVLREMIGNPGDFGAYVARIEALEELGDVATHEVAETLSKGMATPFERADIRALAEALDDILDAIDTVSHKLVLYRAQKVRPEAVELAALLVKMVPVVERATLALREGKNKEAVLVPCREVHKLETDADKVLRRGIGALFDEVKDPIELIKWKEILEILEGATDKCEDAVRVIEEVIRKHD